MLGFGACIANDSGQMRIDDSASTIADSIPRSIAWNFYTLPVTLIRLTMDFAVVPEAYALEVVFILRKETLEAFRRMYDSAMQDGVQLRIVSATRNFNT